VTWLVEEEKTSDGRMKDGFLGVILKARRPVRNLLLSSKGEMTNT
jgi:hypothetical protein